MSELRAPMLLRATRGGVIAVVAMLLAVGAHTMAGGLLPSLPALLAIGLVLAVASSLMLGRPASRLRLVVLVAGGQFAVHTMLTALSGHQGDQTPHRHLRAAPIPDATTDPLPLTATDRAGSFYDLTMTAGNAGRPSDLGVVELPHWVTHILADLTGPHALMAIAHLLAAAGVACWLAVGETALWTLIALLGSAACGLIRKLIAIIGATATGPRPSRRRLVGTRSRHDQPRLTWLLETASRRGPPALA